MRCLLCAADGELEGATSRKRSIESSESEEESGSDDELSLGDSSDSEEPAAEPESKVGPQ